MRESKSSPATRRSSNCVALVANLGARRIAAHAGIASGLLLLLAGVGCGPGGASNSQSVGSGGSGNSTSAGSGNENAGGAITGTPVVNGGTTSTGSGARGGASSGGALGGKPVGGSTSSGGAPSGSAGTTGTGGATSACSPLSPNPFTDCKFSWGAPKAGTNTSYLDFVSTWVGDETRGGLDAAMQTNVSCGDCQMVQQVASSNAIAAFYAYFIGFQACKQGNFCDCNVDTSDGHNLCSDGAQWIRDNRAQIVKMYGEYAKKVYAASPNKPVIWWLEGDFIQYSYTNQSNPLSYAELGALARDITCAIKAGEPNAVVAMNHSPWISNDQATGFWNAQPLDVLDMVWVQGPGDTGTFINSGTYNAATANYAWLHQKTGKPIMAETSFAGAGVADRWTNASASAINQRISEGVIGVLITNPASSYQTSIQSFSALSSVCQ